MKKVIFSLAMVSFSINAFASDMLCTWVGGSEGAGSAGDTLTVASLSSDQVQITATTADDEFIGTYKRAQRHGENEIVAGKDGKNYADYDAGMGDGSLEVLADVALLKKPGSGYVKTRRSGGDGGDTDGIFECSK